MAQLKRIKERTVGLESLEEMPSKFSDALK
jgi:hypothetical protein